MKVIFCPDNLSAIQILEFWEGIGFRHGKDFHFQSFEKNKNLYIYPKTQMVLAQDAIKLGFKIEEI